MSTSNIDNVVRFLDGFVDSFDFKRPGVDQSLGRDVAMKTVDRMQTRALQERRGVGVTWAPNSTKPIKGYPGGYKQWKETHYGVGEPNSRTGQMLSQRSMYGRTRIESKEITMIYGIDKPPDRAVFGTPGEDLFKQDEKVTDVQKAYFAHTGQSAKKITRPFYEVNEDDGKAVSELCQETWNDLIRETNAANGY